VRHHDVTVAGFSDPEEYSSLLHEFPELKGRVHFLNQPFNKRNQKFIYLYSFLSSHSYWYNMTMKEPMQVLLDDLLKWDRFDVVHTEFPPLTQYDFNTDAIQIMDAHNVEYDNLRRMSNGEFPFWKKWFYKIESEKLKQEELGGAAKQQALFVTSKRDASIFEKDVPEIPKFVVPNGVDVHHFQPWNTVKEPNSMVFVGTMQYQPNIDAMNYFLDHIFPQVRKRIPKAKIYIVGSNPPPHILSRRSENVVVTDFVPDVRPYINRSTIYVVPLRMGGGTRLKILEAMAMNVPVVTTSIGCEGLGLQHQETALIADSARKLTDSVVELLRNEELRDQLSRRALDLVHSKYSWEVVGDRIEQAYSQLAGAKAFINYKLTHKQNGE
jgi:glycosyltransferase involved in cell wall biosynthesis